MANTHQSKCDDNIILLVQLLCDKMEALDTATLYDVNEEALNSQGVRRPFPTLDGDKIDQLCSEVTIDDEELECVDTLELYRYSSVLL